MDKERDQINQVKDLLRIEESRPYIQEDGSVIWKLKNGLVHRKYGPAVLSKHGEFWYLYSKLHREDGPAAIYSEPQHGGEKEFYFYYGSQTSKNGLKLKVNGKISFEE